MKYTNLGRIDLPRGSPRRRRSRAHFSHLGGGHGSVSARTFHCLRLRWHCAWSFVALSLSWHRHTLIHHIVWWCYVPCMVLILGSTQSLHSILTYIIHFYIIYACTLVHDGFYLSIFVTKFQHELWLNWELEFFVEKLTYYLYYASLVDRTSKVIALLKFHYLYFKNHLVFVSVLKLI